MDNVFIKNEDKMLMSLVHYFVTKEKYAPILVQGVKDEIWLEKVDGPYRVIRINNNYIHNNEQFEFDQLKIRNILKQIKKKTFSFKINALNINLNEDERVDQKPLKNIDNLSFHDLKDISSNKDISSVFPNITKDLETDLNSVELVLNITDDINEKTKKENIKYEKLFAPKKIIATYIIMGLCLLYYLVSVVLSGSTNISSKVLLLLGANNQYLLRIGQVWRIITSVFIHANLIHLLTNMYSLYIVGPQIEAKFGKTKFIIIFLLSGIGGSLLSAGMHNNIIGVGASGAIFGLLGAMLYFGIHYRLYLKDSLTRKIVPVILLNLLIGFSISGIDNMAHIGGLITGYLITMALGMPEDNDKKDKINGIILLIIFIIFASYLAFIR